MAITLWRFMRLLSKTAGRAVRPRTAETSVIASQTPLVTDKPMFFVGAGAADAKPRAGYGVGLIQMTVDGVGFGSGTMAAAARVGPGGEAGVQVDDYADEPIKLVTVSRLMK